MYQHFLSGTALSSNNPLIVEAVRKKNKYPAVGKLSNYLEFQWLPKNAGWYLRAMFRVCSKD